MRITKFRWNAWTPAFSSDMRLNNRRGRVWVPALSRDMRINNRCGKAWAPALGRGMRINNRRGKAWAPALSHDPPLLLLCAAPEEEAPSSRQVDVAQAPPPRPSTSLSGLADISVFSLNVPTLVGVGGIVKKGSILEVPKHDLVTSLSLPREEEKSDAATLPLQLCDQTKSSESVGPATVTTDLQAMIDEDTEVAVAMMQLDSPSKAVLTQTSSSPSTSSSARKSPVRGA